MKTEYTYAPAAVVWRAECTSQRPVHRPSCGKWGRTACLGSASDGMLEWL